MELKELNKRITALSKRNAAVTAEIQTLGLACLQHGASEAFGGFGDVMPLNRLIAVLNRTQTQAFVEWTLAFGMVKRNTDKKSKDVLFVTFDKERKLDIDGATAKTWDEFAPEKAASIAKAFDLQHAVMQVLKKAAEAGQPESILNALAAAAGIEANKVPKALVPAAVEAADPAIV